MMIKATQNSECLYTSIANVLNEARDKVYRAVNFAMVQAYWEIGRLITEDELRGQRADYGKEVMKNLSSRLTQEFGKGFDERELRKMCQFYRIFPIRDTLRPELTWSHYRRLLSVENKEARVWYMNEAADSTWSTRQLDRQISTLYYERLLASRDKKPVITEALHLHATRNCKHQGQMVLFPQSINERRPGNAPVRVINRVVDMLDLTDVMGIFLFPTVQESPSHCSPTALC